MSYYDDDSYEKCEEYCRQCEEEEIMYVDGGLQRIEDDKIYPSYIEYISSDTLMIKRLGKGDRNMWKHAPML